LNKEKKFAVIIENKWDSGDSCPDQLFKYYRNFTNPKGKGYTDSNLLVIYLTKYGKSPSWVESTDFKKFLRQNHQKNYFPIAYQVQIKNWLEECLIQSNSKKVSYLIEQYLNFIKYGINN